MKHLVRSLIILLFLAGAATLIYFAVENQQLAGDVDRLEAELGRMTIKELNRVHIVEIASPDVPPEVASHIDRMWQFRCYLPPGYDWMKLSGGGRVTDQGLYQTGGSGSGWSSPQPDAVHCLLTVSFQKKDNQLVAFYSFNGMSGTTSWRTLESDRLDAIVVKKLVSSQQGPRSFDRECILPLLKMYNPGTAEVTHVAGKPLTTYEGGQIVLSPKSRETALESLLKGETPPNFSPDWIATAVGDE